MTTSPSRSWFDGIKLEEVFPDEKDYHWVQSKMERTNTDSAVDRYELLKVSRISNKHTWPRYVARREQMSQELGGAWVKERRLFHGSPNAETIAHQGFDRGFAKKSGMFGDGVYFAEHSSKSNNYTYGYKQPCPQHQNLWCSTCVRKILICRVALGRVYEPLLLRVDSLPADYHSIRARALVGLTYPEFVIYNDDQVYPSYLVEYKAIYSDNCSVM